MSFNAAGLQLTSYGTFAHLATVDGRLVLLGFAQVHQLMNQSAQDKSLLRLYRDIARVVVPRRRIALRIHRLADDIAATYDHNGDGNVTILAVLTGSLIFLGDLMRQLPLKMRLDVISVSSYPGKAVRGRGVRLRGSLPASLIGRDVLIIDDVLDSGQTLGTLVRRVQRLRPASLRTCVLLKKDRPGLTGRLMPDFVGFDVADEFIVGYGLDWDGYYRNLPDICVLSRHARRANGGGA